MNDENRKSSYNSHSTCQFWHVRVEFLFWRYFPILIYVLFCLKKVSFYLCCSHMGIGRVRTHNPISDPPVCQAVPWQGAGWHKTRPGLHQLPQLWEQQHLSWMLWLTKSEETPKAWSRAGFLVEILLSATYWGSTCLSRTGTSYSRANGISE